MIHPDDDSGDALRRLESCGDDLARPRNVDFSVVFPVQDSAENFATHFRTLGYPVTVEFTKTVEELPWDVVVVNQMALSHRAIEEFENLLESIASAFNGRNDGWGCFSEPGSPYPKS